MLFNLHTERERESEVSSNSSIFSSSIIVGAPVASISNVSFLSQVEVDSSAAANTVASFQHCCQSHQFPASKDLPCLPRLFQLFVLAAGTLAWQPLWPRRAF